MHKTNILTKTQQALLEAFGKESFSSKFYLSGGTALAEFYVPYRLSEDLDFFSIDKVQTDEIIAFLISIKKQLGFTGFDFNTSFNRNLFFLSFHI